MAEQKRSFAQDKKDTAEAEAIVAKTKAEVTQLEAETRKANAEAAKAEAEADVVILALEKARREEIERLAANKYHRTYVFDDPVNSGSVVACMHQFDVWHRTEPDCDVTLIFNSPGGGVIDGMALFDYLMQFRQRGHKLITVALGYAASMAGILLQAGEERQMGREAYVLIHEVSFGATGKIGEIEDEMKFVKMIQARVLDIFAARSKCKRSYIARQWRRKDWWLNSDTAVKLGIVDSVLGLPIVKKGRK